MLRAYVYPIVARNFIFGMYSKDMIEKKPQAVNGFRLNLEQILYYQIVYIIHIAYYMCIVYYIVLTLPITFVKIYILAGCCLCLQGLLFPLSHP